jgi:uncharacterized protein YecE (DUF72 family)
MSAPLYIGPAGWSYPDWNATVYPPKKPKGFDPLEFLTSYFNLIEINSTFYRVPAVSTVRSWAERVAGAPDFRFTLKLHRNFTHETGPIDARNVDVFKRAVAPLLDAGRLLYVLLQFPWSFRNTAPNRRRLDELIGLLQPFPLAVEVRHGGWDDGDAVDALFQRGAAVCAVDQPLIGDSLGFGTRINRPGGEYFRLHGRNKSEWFRAGTNRDLRYNYFYSQDELEKLASPIRTAAETAQHVVVVLNNHFRGQAVANALELKSMLTGNKVEVPETLLGGYPRLGPIALPDPNTRPEEGWLFGPESAAEGDEQD